jgi:hypothetical protein
MNMLTDLWTKMALTGIAVSLMVIAWKLPFADVGHAQTGTCGSNSSAPCYITSDGDGLKVLITNPHEFH